MKRILTLALAGVATFGAMAEEGTQSEIFKLNAEARMDWDYTGQTIGSNMETNTANTGFNGKYLMLRIDGKIAPGLTYSWRQRLNKVQNDASLFGATDWLNLNYEWDGLEFNAGKQVVAIGGYEYDRSPVNLYGCSVFWNNIACFQYGVSMTDHLGKNDKLLVQLCQSPFFTPQNRDLYAVNAMWMGKHGCWNTIWSANLMEYQPKKWLHCIALGNRVELGNVAIELDVMNRAENKKNREYKDWSVMSEVQYHPSSRWNLFGKFTYDVNDNNEDGDYLVKRGTNLKMAGAGVEFYPIKNSKSLRFHACGFYSWGTNTNKADLMQNKTFYATTGLTFNFDLLNIKKN